MASPLLNIEAVRIDVPAAAKKALFVQLGNLAASVFDLEPGDVAERLSAREKLGSTGFGNGVAIPHARMPGLAQVRGMLVRLTRPIDFRAVDAQSVDLVFALLSPSDAGADHLKALAQVSRRLRDPALIAKLRGAGSPDALFALFTGEEARDSA